MGEVRPIVEDAVALDLESSADMAEQVGQRQIVRRVELLQAQAGFDGGELGEHGYIVMG